MSSVKISNLPSVTSFTFNDVIAVVDSGSSQTSKIELTDLFRNTGNVVESQTNANAIALATDAYSANYQVLRGSNVTSAVVAATQSYIQQGQNHFIGGGNNVYIYAPGGGHSAIIGSDSVSITGSYNHAIIGSYGGPNINGGEENVIAASEGSVSVNGNRNMVSASSNSSIAGGNRNFFGGTQSISISNGTNTIIGGAEGLTINGNPYKFAMFAGYGTNAWNVSDIINGFVGGFYNLKLDNGGGTLRDFAVIASRDDSMGHNYSAMVATSGRTSLYDNTLHTDNIHTYLTETFNVVNAGNVSGNLDVNCAAGTIFQFTLIGNTTPNFINVRTGQRFIFIVFNNGSWTVPTATVNGSPSTVFAKNGAINPTNNGYTKYTATYDGSKMFLDEELAFSAV